MFDFSSTLWRPPAMPSRGELGKLTLSALLVFAAFEASLLGMPSPMSWGDDLAFEVDPRFYLDKLHSEGRWLIHAWHSLLGPSSRTFDFHAAAALWCVASAAASAFLQPRRGIVASTILAAALFANPAILQLLYWPHTSLPMMSIALVTSIMLLMLRASFGWWLVALGAGVGINALSYQLFSLYFFSLGLMWCLGGTRDNGTREAMQAILLRSAAVIFVCAASVVCGTLAAYALNYASFGHFGFRIEEWRYGTSPAGSVNNAILAALGVRDSFTFLSTYTFHVFPLLLVALVVVWIVRMLLGRFSLEVSRALLYAMILFMLLAAALAPFAIPALRGIPLPSDRGSLTIYLVVVGAGVFLAVRSSPRMRRVTFGALLALATAATGFYSREARTLAKQDTYNHMLMSAVASDIVREAPMVTHSDEGQTFVTIVGDVGALRGPAHGEAWWSVWLLGSELRLLGSNAKVAHCIFDSRHTRVEVPEVAQWLREAPSFPASGYIRSDGSAILAKLGPGTTDCKSAP